MRNHASRTLARSLCRALGWLAPAHLQAWTCGIGHEVDAIADDGEALRYAIHGFAGLAPHFVALHLLCPFLAAAASADLADRGLIDRNLLDQIARRPRALGLASATGAVCLGALFMLMADAPARHPAINASALAIGLLSLALFGRNRRAEDLWPLALAGSMLVTALLGLTASGATGWIVVAGLPVHPGTIGVPVIVMAFSRSQSLPSAVGVVLAAVAVAIQPDRAVTAMLAAGLGVLAVMRGEWRSRLAFMAGAVSFGGAMLRPDGPAGAGPGDDTLPSLFAAGLAARSVAAAGLGLLMVPAVVGYRHAGEDRPVHATFGAMWLAAFLAAASGHHPAPLVSYGGSAVLGYVLSLAAFPARPRPVADAPGRAARQRPRGSRTITKQTQQTFILQAWDDEVDGIQQSLIYARALETAGVPAEVHLFAHGGHAFGLRPTGHPVDRWPRLVEDWLADIGVLPKQRR